MWVAILLLTLTRRTFLPNDNCKAFRDRRKITKRSTLVSDIQHEYLPSHKADCFFKGNWAITTVQVLSSHVDPRTHFNSYLSSCDSSFPVSSPLWLTSGGTLSRFLHASLALVLHQRHWKEVHAEKRGNENGVSLSIIQAVGRWTSDFPPP